MRILLLLLPLLLFAQSYKVSNIPLPKLSIENLNIAECNQECLEQLLEDEQIFSFLARITSNSSTQELKEQFFIYSSLLNIAHKNGINQEFKVALLLPYKVIGRYASMTTKTTFAYMLARNTAFEIKSYQVEDESAKEFQKAIELIKQDGFNYVIAPLTLKGVVNIATLNTNSLELYFPTIHKSSLQGYRSNFFFGGIDYKKQLSELMKNSVSPLALFYDSSDLANRLNNYTKEIYAESNTTYKKELVSFKIKRHDSNLKKELKGNRKIQRSSVFLNTPIVKSAMIMSQLTLYDANVTNILSTQINYDPILLSMTQYDDRRTMIIANSIGLNNKVIIEANSLLENDINYDWINYATTIGVDYFHHKITTADREYPQEMIENQIEYDITLLKPTFSRFVKYVTPEDKNINTDDLNIIPRLFSKKTF